MRQSFTPGTILLLCALAGTAASAQQLNTVERQRGLDMLSVVQQDIKRNYFDTLYKGVDLAATFAAAESRIKAAVTVEQVLGVIANATAAFNDSHTLFLPPGLIYRAEYGWELRFVGDTCRLTRVFAGSDAEGQGLRVGDAVLSAQGIPLTRANLWQLEYLLRGLRPVSSVNLEVRDGKGAIRRLDVAARIVQRHNILDFRNSTDVWELLRSEQEWKEASTIRWEEMGGGTLAVWLPRFRGDDDWVDEIAKALRGRQAVVIDLRGNGGGSVDQLSRFLGLFYDDDLSAARFVERRKVSEFKVEGKGTDRFEGQVIVLVDAASASASELFARTMQLTRRGTVLGDRSAGAVRVSRTYVHMTGTQTAAFYGASVTVSDVIMPDGGVLEGVGVTPDETVLPTGDQLNRRADPVLARAMALLGVTMTAEQAGLHRR